jgi:hypothetical protein
MEKGRIEAYTLMEVAVAMLLAAVCISICYTAYGMIGNYFSVFEKKNNVAQQVLALQRTMDNDIQRSRGGVWGPAGRNVPQATIKFSDQFFCSKRTMDNDIQRSRLLLRTADGIMVQQDSLNVRYHFSGAMLSREAEGLRTDSFTLVLSEEDFRFENRVSLEGDTVDRIGFVIALEKGGKVPMLFKKVYSAQDLFR